MRVHDIDSFRAALQKKSAAGAAPDPQDAWFAALPAAEQERLRQVWAQQDARPARWHAMRRRRALRLMRECAMLLPIPLFCANLLLLSFGKLLLLTGASAGAGALIGFVIHRGGLGRFGASLLGLLGYFAMQMTLGGFKVGVIELMFLFLGAWLSTMLFAAYGFRIELRDVEGEDWIAPG